MVPSTYLLIWEVLYLDANSDHISYLSGYDADVLKFLPANIRAMFPAVLTRRSGISTVVMNDMISSVMHNMSFSSYRSKLLEAHLTKGTPGVLPTSPCMHLHTLMST